jgi:hypothetical protein
MALEMGVYIHRHKRTENAKMRYTVPFIPHCQLMCPSVRGSYCETGETLFGLILEKKIK